MSDISQPKLDPRHISRILAAQYLFSQIIQKKLGLSLGIFEANSLLTENEFNPSKYNTKLYEELVEGVEENENLIDNLIREKAPAWPLEQINPADLAVLRLAIWEGKFYKQTPYKVVINEAIEVAKLLSSDQSAKFINGVLGAILTDQDE